MIEGVLIILLLSGEAHTYIAPHPFVDIATCRTSALETMNTLKDKQEIIGMGFTCKPAGKTL